MDLDLVTTATVDITTRHDRIITGTTAGITNSGERTTTGVTRIPTTRLNITTAPTSITITGTGMATIAAIDSGFIRVQTVRGVGYKLETQGETLDHSQQTCRLDRFLPHDRTHRFRHRFWLDHLP